MESIIKLNLDINTKDLDKSITEEILKNIQCDIQDLISVQYGEYLDNCEIKSETYDILSIEGFHVGNMVKFKKQVGEDYCDVPLGSIGIIIDIDKNDMKYPIECEFEDRDMNYGFKPEELELVE